MRGCITGKARLQPRQRIAKLRLPSRRPVNLSDSTGRTSSQRCQVQIALHHMETFVFRAQKHQGNAQSTHMHVNGPTRHQFPLLFYAAGRALYRDHGEPYVPCYTPLMAWPCGTTTKVGGQSMASAPHEGRCIKLALLRVDFGVPSVKKSCLTTRRF